MKQRVLSLILAVAFAFTSIAAAAQQTTNIEAIVRQIAKEFDDTKGVDCMVLEKGVALGMVKGAFKPMFGSAFMKNVTSMVIIDYSDASEEICNAIRSKVEGFSKLLDDLTPDKSEQKEGEYTRCYATINGTSISDFMIIMESDKNKMFLYMGGVLDIEKLEMEISNSQKGSGNSNDQI